MIKNTFNKAEHVLWHELLQSRNVHILLIHLLQCNFLERGEPHALRKLLPRIIFHMVPQLGGLA